VLLNPIDYAIISVGSLVIAGESLEAWILRQLECQSPLLPQLLKFSDDAIWYVWYT
jgi:hypothetical protein